MDKIFLFFPDDTKFGKEEMAKHVENMKTAQVNKAVFVFKVEPKNVVCIFNLFWLLI